MTAVPSGDGAQSQANSVTFDVEDWHELVRRRIVRGASPVVSPHVVADTHRILDLLDARRVRATFFVVGSVADTHPDLVRQIAARGHEVGSHSYAHRLISTMTQAELRGDVSRSRRQLQDLTGQNILGFRAPEFSVGRLDHWCFDVLAEEGFAYDSSVFPVRGTRYGVQDAPRSPFKIRGASGRVIWEYPLAVASFGLDGVSASLPVAGGTYYRVLPLIVLKIALRQIAARGTPAVLYFHPYEFHQGLLFALDGPRSSTAGPQHRLTEIWKVVGTPSSLKLHVMHNFATRSIARRLDALLSTHHFVPLGEIFERTHAVIS